MVRSAKRPQEHFLFTTINETNIHPSRKKSLWTIWLNKMRILNDFQKSEKEKYEILIVLPKSQSKKCIPYSKFDTLSSYSRHICTICFLLFQLILNMIIAYEISSFHFVYLKSCMNFVFLFFTFWLRGKRWKSVALETRFSVQSNLFFCTM